MKKKLYVVTLFTLSFLLSLFLGVKDVYAENYPFNGMIMADALGVHNAPNVLSNSQVTEIAFGTKVKVLGVQGTVYKIEYGSSIGYVAKSQVINVDASMSQGEGYNSYCDSLKNNGFPDSYCPYLFYLHNKYPAWGFRAENTGVSLGEAAEKEKWLSALQTSNSNYYLNGTALEADYYYVNADVVKMFLDAKNGLFENLIFQYMDLESSKSIINDTAINAVATGNLANYKNDFKAAADKYGYNALHLLARSKQEGASNPRYRAVTGTYTTELNNDPSVTTSSTYEGNSLDGYYNFYNIGAYPLPSMNLGAIGRGLAYAAGFIGGTSYGRPWTTPQLAIAGGAEFLKEQYVSRGQNTLYYEKFNVGPNNTYSKYSHQYMTNIYAPIQEAKNIYSAYSKAGLLASNFVFLIPVYTDSGASNNGSSASDLSYNNNLKEIKVNDVLINGFDRDVTEYYYKAPFVSDDVNVTVVTEDPGATVSGAGVLKLVENRATARIIVTAPSGTQKTYVVTVERETVIDEGGNNIVGPEIKVDNVINGMEVKTNGDIMFGFSPGTDVSFIINKANDQGAKAVINSANNDNKSSGKMNTLDKAIITGSRESKTYNIAVRGDIDGDGEISALDLLKCKKHILGVYKLEGAQFFAGDTSFDNEINALDLLKIKKHIIGSSKL